jgi:hypothetical protein
MHFQEHKIVKRQNGNGGWGKTAYLYMLLCPQCDMIMFMLISLSIILSMIDTITTI